MSLTKNQKDFIKMVEKDPHHIVFVPEEEQFLELVKIAVKSNGSTLNDVREDLRTKEVYELAVASYGPAIKYVPREMITNKMLKLAVKNSPEIIEDLGELDYSVYEVAIEAKPAVIKYVPKDMLDRKLCLLALNLDGRTIKFIEQTQEYCEIAISNNWKAINFIENKTPELCMLAYEQDKRALKFINL